MMERLCSALAGIGFALAIPAAVNAATFTDVYFFGASQNDTGNAGPLDFDPSGVLTGTFGFRAYRRVNRMHLNFETPPAKIQTQIYRNPETPGIKRTLHFKSIDLLYKFDKRLLRKFRGIVFI